MSDTESIRRLISADAQQHNRTIDEAERVVLSNLWFLNFSRMRAIEEVVLPKNFLQRVFAAFSKDRDPDYAAFARELQEMFSTLRSAYAFAAEQRSVHEARGKSISPEAKHRQNCLSAVSNGCDALRAYCHSMATGEDEVRAKILEYYESQRRIIDLLILQRAGLA